MNASNTLAKADFLFLIEIRDPFYYQHEPELREFLTCLPESIRIYSIIHGGMNTVKVYGITSSMQDYEKVKELTGMPTEIIDSRNPSQNQSTGNN